MASRIGPYKEFDHLIELRLTQAMIDHLDRIRNMAGVSRAEVIRGFIQDSIDMAEGTYDPLPSGLTNLERSTLVAMGGVGRG